MNQFPAILGPWAIIVLVVVGYIFFWCGLMIVIARFGGWIALAQKYRATAPFEGQRWYFQHAQFRWSCNYGGCLTVGANPQGLYISVWPMFRPGHPKLFIPWSETAIEMKQSFWMGKYMEIQFPQVPGTLIRFRQRLAERIAAAVGPNASP